MNALDGNGALAQLLRGDVLHARRRPRAHAFRYRVTTLLLPMRALAASPSPDLARNRAGLYAFHDADHGEGGTDALAWVESLFAREGVQGADGEIWLQTFPRVLGYVFKPVSFWYALRRDGALAAVVAEVNNTFGERHVYLLAGPGLRWGATVRARKVFHVSPFCRVQGEYVFRFMRSGDRWIARVEHHDGEHDARLEREVPPDDQGPLLVTSIGGTAEPLTAANVRRAFWRSPLMTLAVTTRIHWQALRLLAKRVPWFSKPTVPPALISR
jgi:DUF1365 family protein